MPDYPFEQLTIPALIIHGTNDPFVPFETANHLAARIRGAKLLSLKNGGHLSFLIQHEKTRDAIYEFMGLPYLTGKSLTTKDTKYTKGEKSLDFVGFPFVTVVSFVFEKWHPVKNGRAEFIKTNSRQ